MNDSVNNAIKEPVKASRKKAIFSISLLVLSIFAGVLVSFLALSDDLSGMTLEDFFRASSKWIENWYWMVAAFACFVVIIITGAFRVYIMLKSRRQRVSFRDSFHFSLLSKYYVLITPLGLGGQPITMVLMRKKNIPLGLATFIPTIDLLAMRCSMLVLAILAFIFKPNVVPQWIEITAYFGAFFTALLPVTLILLSFYSPFEKLVLFFLEKMTFLKQQRQIIKWVTSTFKKYQKAYMDFKGSGKSFILVVFLALISQLALVSIPFFILQAYPEAVHVSSLGVDFNYFNIVAMVLYANSVFSFIPTLGNAGAAEFSFSTIFSTFIGGSFLFWALFAWRFLTFYLFLLIGLGTTIQLGINSKKEIRRTHLPDFSKKTRIVLFCDNFYPMIDGVIRSVDSYARHLLAAGYDPIVVVPGYKEKRPESLPYQVLRAPSVNIPGFEYAMGIFPFGRKINQAIYSDAPTIYHIHSPFFIGLRALKIARLNNFPVVASFHSKYYDDFYHISHSRTLSGLALTKVMSVFRHADSVWSVSKSTAKTLIQYGYKGKIEVVNNGTDFTLPTNIESLKTQVLRYLKLNSEENNILFVGHLVFQKNIMRIIETLQILDQQNFPYHMIFVGEGGHEKWFKKYVEKQNIKGRITFCGSIRDKDFLAAIYASCDLFFFPSVYDNAPLVVKEAAVAKLPSLLIKGSNSAEGIVDGVNGFLEKDDAKTLANKISVLFSNKQALLDVGVKASTTLPSSWDTIIADVINRYELLIKDYYYEEE